MAEKRQFSTINISHVLRSIWTQPGITRTAIAEFLNLNKSTISKIVAPLIDMNIVKVVRYGEASPQGGRKPIHLTINNEYGFVLGLEIKTDGYIAVGVDLHGEVLFSHSAPLPENPSSFGSLFFQILTETNKIINQTEIPLLGIGLGLAGIVNPHEGIIHESRCLDIHSPLNLYDEVSHIIGVPLLVEKDANCCSWAELAFPHDETTNNFLSLLTEYRRPVAFQEADREFAVGLGFVLDGKIHYGDNYSSGEFRSIFHRDKKVWNAFAMSDAEVAAAETDRALFMRLARELARNIALLTNTLNIRRIILCGDVHTYRTEIQHLLEEEIAANWPYAAYTRCVVHFSRHNEYAVAFGAAAMFIEKLFCYPELTLGSEKKILTGLDLLKEINRRLET